jgi:hypothetical protein
MKKKERNAIISLVLFLTYRSCQQYKSIHSHNLNVTMDSLCCQQYKKVPHAKLCPISTKRGNSGQIFVEGLYIKFHFKKKAFQWEPR